MHLEVQNPMERFVMYATMCLCLFLLNVVNIYVEYDEDDIGWMIL